MITFCIRQSETPNQIVVCFVQSNTLNDMFISAFSLVWFEIISFNKLISVTPKNNIISYVNFNKLFNLCIKSLIYK